MAPISLIYHHLLFFLLLLLLHAPPYSATGGSWSLLHTSIGISAMHMQLLPNDRVVMYDRTDFGTSNISLPHRKCPLNSTDCSAHSIEYDISRNSVRPLSVLTNFWCSSGSLMPDGRLVQTGGFSNGYRVVRIYESCNTCDWKEIEKGLNRRRWYATNHILPDGRQIIIGGRESFNYEFYPKTSTTDKPYNLPFLSETNDPRIENNLYPFVFLTPEGHLFMFANNRAILLDYTNNKVLKTFPTIPGGQPRNYPSSGSAVILPLKMKQGSVVSFGVLVCGGAPKGALLNARKGKFDRALDTCGRIKISDQNPQWEMDTMPLARVMGDMLLLPNGHVLIINGASAGTAGWENGRNPVLRPVIYRPKNPIGSRFEVQNPSRIPRMYHSTAILLRDGRVLIGGSNPHQRYEFRKVMYPTELSLEAFSPSYLESSSSRMRPKIISPKSKTDISYGERVIVQFDVTGGLDPNSVSVTLISPSFNTHSFSMNQRLLILERTDFTMGGRNSNYKVHVTAPSSGNIAPAGNYLLFVVHREIPSPGIWIKLH